MNVFQLIGIKNKINALRQRYFTASSENVSVEFSNMRITQISVHGNYSLDELKNIINQSLAEQEELALATLT